MEKKSCFYRYMKTFYTNLGVDLPPEFLYFCLHVHVCHLFNLIARFLFPPCFYSWGLKEKKIINVPGTSGV